LWIIGVNSINVEKLKKYQPAIARHVSLYERNIHGIYMKAKR
jgi:hypothetical protein